jgi:hypothetical protein
MVCWQDMVCWHGVLAAQQWGRQCQVSAQHAKVDQAGTGTKCIMNLSSLVARRPAQQYVLTVLGANSSDTRAPRPCSVAGCSPCACCFCVTRAASMTYRFRTFSLSSERYTSCTPAHQHMQDNSTSRTIAQAGHQHTQDMQGISTNRTCRPSAQAGHAGHQRMQDSPVVVVVLQPGAGHSADTPEANCSMPPCCVLHGAALPTVHQHTTLAVLCLMSGMELPCNEI